MGRRNLNARMFRAALAAALCFFCVGPSLGAQKRAAVVNLENRRKVTLVKFEIIAPAEKRKPEKVLAAIGKSLGAGDRIDLPLARASGCVFEARWKFEDLEDSGSVDLCTDAHIVLVD